MMPGQALLRLMWRPATVMLVVMLPLFAVVAPLTVLSYTAEDPLRVLFTHMPQARAALFRLAIMVPAALGLFVGIYRAELEGLLIGRAMPRREQLASGTAIFAAVAAAGVYVLASRALPAAQSIALATLALVWFALPLVIFRPVGRAVRWLLIFGLVALAVAPAPLIRTVELAPVFSAAGGAALLVCALLAIRVVRPEMGPWSLSPWLESFALPSGRTRHRIWDIPLAGARPLAWLQAAAYETGTSLPGSHVRAAAYVTLVGYALQMTFLIPLGMAGFLSDSGTKLSGDLVRPLSRAERARIAFRGATTDAVALYAAAAVFLLLLTAAGVPSFGWFAEEMKPVSAVAMLGFGFAFAPLQQFQGICRRARGGLEKPGVAHYISFLLYVMGTQAAAIVATRMGLAERPFVLLGAVTLAAATTYTIHRFLLRQFFATADLASSG